MATPGRLERAALHYLERFASSAENLRRVLMRRVERSARIHGTDREAGARAVDDILARFARAGLLDDAGYAAMRARSLFRRGASLRAIRYRLGLKGVAEVHVEAALEALRDEVAEPDLAAAIAYARRRRLGPWRTGDREAFRDRDLAALGRQGFGYGVARKVLDADGPEACEALIGEPN